MFRKLTLADIIKQDIAAAEILAHDHDKAAEHHDALATMYWGRLERLKADLGGPLDLPSRMSGASTDPPNGGDGHPFNFNPRPPADQPRPRPPPGPGPAPAAGDQGVSLEAFGRALAAARAAFSRMPAP